MMWQTVALNLFNSTLILTGCLRKKHKQYSNIDVNYDNGMKI